MKQLFIQLRNASYQKNVWDDNNLAYDICYDNIVQQVVDFFKYGSKLIYPAKSFFVAIVYAQCFEEFYSQDFYQMLNDKDLLFDDKFFATYAQSTQTYDKILASIDRNQLLSLPSVQKTIHYFKKEFDLLCN